MPKVNDTPNHFRPYVFHGLDLSWRDGESQAVGDCPWCGKEGKFSVDLREGLWRCWVCAEGSDRGGGNVYTFLRHLWERSTCLGPQAVALARDRGLMEAGTLEAWGAVVSCLDGSWLLPGYNEEGKLTQLYKYVKGKERTLLMPTPTLPHGMFRAGLGAGGNGNSPAAEVKAAWVCEGPWDGMALWEVLRKAKPVEGGDGVLTLTGNEAVSLGASVTVLAVPGATVFPEKWVRLLAGKEAVVLAYDHDDAGRAGAKRTAGILAGTEELPARVEWVNWKAADSDDGFTPLPDGSDVRDWVTEFPGPAGRVASLTDLLALVEPIPGNWIAGRSRAAKATGSTSVETLPCRSWTELRTQWRKAMLWFPGLDRALACMLATVASTGQQGDPLWIKLVGPPSSGKTELCEALTTCRRWVKAKSTIRGLFSGYQSDREGSEDMSLAPQLRGMTLVTKDGDTLLQSPNLSQILAEFRDAYDRVSRTQYRNKMSRDYDGLNMTWILAGTEALRLLDSSELGERMLDVVICTGMDEEMEELIGLRKVHQAIVDLNHAYDGKAETRDTPEKLRAKRLTGGFVEYLRGNACELYSGVEVSDAVGRECLRLGTFTSFLRSRPSKRQDETSQKELPFRLASQLVRLAKSLAVVYGYNAVNEDCMGVVRQVALDTCRGKTLDLVGRMYAYGDAGVVGDSLVLWCGLEEKKVNALVQHLRGIEAVEKFRPTNEATGKPERGYRFRLTDRLGRLYREIYGT